MSEGQNSFKLKDERFSSFVMEHAEQAMRWEVMDRRPEVPFNFVQFETTSISKKRRHPRSQSVARYIMDLWIKLPTAQQKPGITSAGILLEMDSDNHLVTLTDDCDQLQSVMPASWNGRIGGEVVGVLLDQLQVLEDRDALIPAGRRTFPLDGNPIKHL